MAVLAQGLVLLVSGMGIVYLFLIMLVWVMNRVTPLVARLSYILPDEQLKKKPAVAPRQAAAGSDSVFVAIAIAAAQARAV